MNRQGGGLCVRLQPARPVSAAPGLLRCARNDGETTAEAFPRHCEEPLRRSNPVLRRQTKLLNQCLGHLLLFASFCADRVRRSSKSEGGSNSVPGCLIADPQRKNPPRASADGFWAEQLTMNKTHRFTGPVKWRSKYFSTAVEKIGSRSGRVSSKPCE
jgi:hypothetical protein